MSRRKKDRRPDQVGDSNGGKCMCVGRGGHQEDDEDEVDECGSCVGLCVCVYIHKCKHTVHT